MIFVIITTMLFILEAICTFVYPTRYRLQRKFDGGSHWIYPQIRIIYFIWVDYNPNVVNGTWRWWDGDWERAEKEFKRFILMKRKNREVKRNIYIK